MLSFSFFCFFSLLPPFLLFLLAPEKLIEGLKSPEPALLLPELLPLADPFGSTSDAVNGKAPRPVPSCHSMACPALHGHPCAQPLLLGTQRGGSDGSAFSLQDGH